MTASHFFTDDANFWAEAAVIVPAIFLIVYSWWHHWWHDTYGRCLAVLASALIGARLSQDLNLWGLHWHWVKWLSVNAVGAGPIVFGILTWKIIYPHLPWVRKRDRFHAGLDKILEKAGRDEPDWRR